MKKILAAALAGTALTAVPGVAWGQVAAPVTTTANPAGPAPTDEADKESRRSETRGDIVVTASRTGNGFGASTPTNVITSALIQAQGATNVAQVLDQVPGFTASINPTTSGARAPNAGAWQADLRALGPLRTLVLFNGARVVPMVPASTRGSPGPDLNQVPSLMVDRVEVVTGGAAAQWGSDAVSGVVNIILRKKFTGLMVSAQSGVAEPGDYGNYRLGFLAGANFAGGRGNILLSADYVKNNGIGDIYSRDWGRDEYQIVPNAASATNGLPPNLLLPNVHAPTTPGGVISGPANFSLRNFKFLPGGAIAPFQVGQFQTGNFMVGGEGQSLLRGVSLSPKLERFAPFVRAQLQVTPSILAYVEGSYAISKAQQITAPTRDNGLVILRSNAFLPTVVANAMDAQGIASFTLTRTDYDLGQTVINIENKTPRIVVGVDGKLGDGWTWDAHYVWTRNQYLQVTEKNRIRGRFPFAVDAVQSGGSIVCRATLPGPAFNPAAAGCVPINLFGDGAPSQAAIDYVTGSGRSTVRYSQQSAAANIKGEPFSTWAGPVSFAAGVEYRSEKQVTSVDPIGQVAGFEYANSSPLTGSFDVIEGYTEAIVPLVADAPLIKALDVNGAVRLARYSSSGTVTTWKVGAVYSPVEGVRFRGTFSRDIRAPAIFELRSPGTTGPTQITVRGFSVNIPANTTAGNPNLKPESAKTLTAGVVVQPVGIPGLRASIDYFDINISDAIVAVLPATAGTLCTAGQQYFCNGFTFGPTGAPTALFLGLVNGAALQTKGVDVVLSYARPVSDLFGSGSGNISVAFNGSYVSHLYSALGINVPKIDRAGESDQVNLYTVPHFRGNLTLTYSDENFSLSPRLSYVSQSTLDNTYNTSPATLINYNRVPAAMYVDLFATVNVGKEGAYQLTFGIKNLLDRDPPPTPSFGSYLPANGTYYDLIGRQFQVGVNIRL